MTGIKQVTISEQLYNNLQKYLGKTAFINVNELAEYIFQDFLEQKESKKFSGASPKENDQIRKRLENLGYL